MGGLLVGFIVLAYCISAGFQPETSLVLVALGVVGGLIAAPAFIKANPKWRSRNWWLDVGVWQTILILFALYILYAVFFGVKVYKSRPGKQSESACADILEKTQPSGASGHSGQK